MDAQFAAYAWQNDQRVARLTHLPCECIAVQRREFPVKSGHQLQVMRQHSQLGGAAKLELHPVVDIQRGIEAVDVRSQLVSPGRAFI